MIVWPLIFVFFIGVLVGTIIFNKPLGRWAAKELLADEEKKK